jgi:hypothetical protein
MDEIDVAALRERILARFLAAWPERDVPIETIEASLDVSIEAEASGPMLYVRLLGGRTGFGFDGSAEEAAKTADELADHFAYNAEGDRWIGGEGWREYRPDAAE